VRSHKAKATGTAIETGVSATDLDRTIDVRMAQWAAGHNRSGVHAWHRFLHNFQFRNPYVVVRSVK